MKKRLSGIGKYLFIFLISLWIIAIFYAARDFRINGYAVYDGKFDMSRIVFSQTPYFSS